MKTKIKLDDFVNPVGTFIKPLLDVGYTTKGKKSVVYFNNEEEITNLYNRYKEQITWDFHGLQNKEDIKKYMITIDDFLQTEHVLILLGCVRGCGHEVLNS